MLSSMQMVQNPDLGRPSPADHDSTDGRGYFFCSFLQQSGWYAVRSRSLLWIEIFKKLGDTWNPNVDVVH